MIKTSFTDGISFVLESSPEQLVCVDTNKSLKFYDFRHENEKKFEDALKANLDKMVITADTRFSEIDTDRAGYLEIE